MTYNKGRYVKWIIAALPRLHRAVPGGGKIIGGEYATQGDFPYMFSLV